MAVFRIRIMLDDKLQGADPATVATSMLAQANVSKDESSLVQGQNKLICSGHMKIRNRRIIRAL